VRRFGHLCAVAALAVTALSCGSDEPAGPTDRELLEAIMEGDPNDTEVEAKLATADLLCTVEPEVLNVIWADLDSDQFEFQEFVFQHRCPKDNTFLLELRTAKKRATTTTTSTTTTTRPRRTSTSFTPPTTDSTSTTEES
jgi:hypothetical protein